MIFLELFIEFFQIGLFAIGGGPATLPFLMNLAERKPWFTVAELTNMVAISESTPGPLGINMATYVGYHTAGIPGALVATFALVLPSVIVIILVAKFLKGYSENRLVKSVFYGVRPAVAGLIASAVVGIWEITILLPDVPTLQFNWPMVALCLGFIGLMSIKKLKKLHPALWLVAGAVLGIGLQL